MGPEAHSWVLALNPCGRRRLDGQPQRITSPYRRALARRFPEKTYGQRWQIETVFSMLKRRLGAALRARRAHSQHREIALRLATHNLVILLRLLARDVLYRACQEPFWIPLGASASGVRKGS